VHTLWTIRPPTRTDFSSRTPPTTELPPLTRFSRVSLTTVFIPSHPQNSAPDIFLNCTKNTELTPRPFARTFVHAPKYSSNNPGQRQLPARDETWAIGRIRHHLPLEIKIWSTHESNNAMDHLSHPFSGQSQATHHQPFLHRRSRPSTLRPQGRLPRRILRRCSPHRTSSDLRGYLRPPASQRDCRSHRNSAAARNSSTARYPIARHSIAPDPRRLPTPSSQISPTRSRSPQSQSGPTLVLIQFHCRRAPEPVFLPTGRWQLATALNCEHTVNSSCGNLIPHPRIKPVIAGDTTCSVSLLTGTISGSNFAIPEP
jgi:hypothetical protein